MKTNPLLFAVLIAVATLLTSCGDKIVYTLIVNNSIMVQEGATTSGSITAGNGGYKIINLTPDIVKAEVEGSTITYTGISEGECDITLKDAEDKTASIHVIVGIKPVPFSNSFSAASTTEALNAYGLSLEEKKDELAGKRSFTIKASNNEKLARAGVDENYVLTSKTIRYSFEINPLNELTFQSLPFSFSVTYKGDFFTVIVKDSRAVDSNKSQLAGFYFKARK